MTIAYVAGESARIGAVPFLMFLAVISVSLGVLNLLPIPVLDGGHLLYLLIEAIKEGLSPDQIIPKPAVDKRIKRYFHDEDVYQENLTKYTKMDGNVIVTDFRSLESVPHGNRFSVFPAYPDGNVHIRLQASGMLRVKVSVSKSITNKTCTVNIGKMLEEFGGGGPAGAGTCLLGRKTADKRIEQIIGSLKG